VAPSFAPGAASVSKRGEIRENNAKVVGHAPVCTCGMAHLIPVCRGWRFLGYMACPFCGTFFCMGISRPC
jgi:hypothetical protein